MSEFIVFFRNMIASLWNLVASVPISYGNASISLGSVIVVFIIISFVIGLFWKGAQG